MKFYTLGIWTVKKGQEKVFTQAWKKFAKWTFKNQGGSSTATLLQDLETPQRFISYGPWKSMKDIETWRSKPEFQKFIKTVGNLCVEIKPQTLKLVVTIK